MIAEEEKQRLISMIAPDAEYRTEDLTRILKFRGDGALYSAEKRGLITALSTGARKKDTVFSGKEVIRYISNSYTHETYRQRPDV